MSQIQPNRDIPPNIVVVVADNVGWADVGFNSGPPTPYIDSISQMGVRFNRHYVQTMGSPSRASLLTGRYAVNTGITWALPLGTPAGLPDHIPTLPSTLLSMGYSTAMAGTWDLGYSQWKQTPTGKGFQEFVGSFASGADEVTKSHNDAPWREVGMDWVHSFDNGTHVHFAETRSATYAITEEAQRMIISHAAQHEGDKPLFMYVSYSAAAHPGDAITEQCNYIPNLWRRRHCSAMSKIDSGVRAILDTARNSLGENTVFLFTPTTAGSPWHGGLNAPFRGGQGSTLEGGVRVPAFAVDLTADGRYFGAGGWSYNGPTHISDWFPTFLSIAKGSTVRYTASGGDGIDMTLTLRYYRNRRLHREDLLLELHHDEDPRFDRDSIAIMSQDMKYIEGYIRDSQTYLEPSGDRLAIAGKSWSISSTELLMRTLEFVSGGNQRFRAMKNALRNSLVTPQVEVAAANRSVYLYNVTTDPKEMLNIAEKHPDIVAMMREKVKKIYRVRSIPQQQYFMHHEITPTLSQGVCDMNPAVTSTAPCMFLNPWVQYDADPFDTILVNSYDTDGARLQEFSIVCVVLIFVLVGSVFILFGYSQKAKVEVKVRPSQ